MTEPRQFYASTGRSAFFETGASFRADFPPLSVRPNERPREGEIAMFTHKSALMACGAAVLALTLASPGGAASTAASQANHLTFSGPVGLPGVTLPRGTCTFEVIPLHPDIVRVLSRDGSRAYFTGFTMRVARPPGLSADQLVTLAETPRGVAPRITAWYPIGASDGQAFRYSDTAR